MVASGVGGVPYSVMMVNMIPSMLLMHMASKSQTGRKRKQLVSSSGPANSSGTANTAGPSPSSAPSIPFTQTHGDVISMPALPHSGNSSKPLMMFGAEGPSSLASTLNQLGRSVQVRFQPRVGRYLAAAAEIVVSILDVETQASRHTLQLKPSSPVAVKQEKIAAK